jgi:tetratricopeptide (TPR) repeat protein
LLHGVRPVVLGFVFCWIALPAVGLAQTPESAARLLAENRLDDARVEYRALIDRDPLVPAYHVGLARVLLATGETQAVTTLLLPTAIQWMGMGRYLEAADLLAVAVEAAPSSMRAWGLLGRAQALGRRYRAAENPLRKAVELGDRNLTTLLLLGSTLWENGSLEEAEAVLIEALAVPSGDPMLAEHQLASLWLWQGRYADAIESLARVVQTRPGWIGARVDLARALQAEGRFEESRFYFESYLEIVPRDPKARYGLATVLARLGERELAAEQMRISAELRERARLTTLEEGRLQATLDEVTFLLGQGRPEEALSRLETMPRSIEVLRLLSRALRMQGDLEGALQALEEAVAQDPSRADVRSELVALYSVESQTP